MKSKFSLKTTLFFMISVLLLLFCSTQFIPDSTFVSGLVSGLIHEKQLPIYCVESSKKQIALSFDAAWGNEDTQQILDILKKHDVKVTFFMTGGWIESYPDDVKAIAEAGHDLGNHSENHKQMSTLTKEECIKELQIPHDKVKELTGKEMVLFRPPYGDYNDTLLEATKELGYYCIQWDVDTLVI